MSSAIFPLSRLPLASRSLRRVASRAVPVQRAENGKGYPIRRQLSPRRRWAMEFGNMSEAAGEVAELARFAAIHGGRADTFLLRDPLDYQVSDHGFGVGNGSTTAFQLQRAMAGSVSDVLGTWPLYTKRRTNLCAYNAWGLTAGVSLATNAAVDPLGGVTADVASYDGSGTAGGYRLVTDAVSNALPGERYASSVWLRVPSGTLSLRLSNNLGGDSTITLTTQWQRFCEAGGVAAGVYPAQIVLHSTAADNSAWTIHVWGGQIELGTTPSRRIANTGGAAVSADPAYWPALGDGFEPITEPGPDLSLTIEGDGLGLRTLRPYQRSNLLTYSEQFDNAAWSKTVTVTPNVGGAPDGNVTADKLDGPGQWAFQYYTVGDGQHVCHSVYVFPGECQTVRVEGVTKANTQAFVDFNLLTGEMTPTGALVAYGIDRSSSYPRCWIVFNVGIGVAGLPRLAIHPIGASGGLYVWGAQVEIGIAPGDYIPTTSAAASRTDYTLGSLGVVTFAVAPRVGAQLASSGSFYRRVRFAMDDQELERIASGVWRSGRVELEEEPA